MPGAGPAEKEPCRSSMIPRKNGCREQMAVAEPRHCIFQSDGVVAHEDARVTGVFHGGAATDTHGTCSVLVLAAPTTSYFGVAAHHERAAR
jgi:hypothetical protein